MAGAWKSRRYPVVCECSPVAEFVLFWCIDLKERQMWAATLSVEGVEVVGERLSGHYERASIRASIRGRRPPKTARRRTTCPSGNRRRSRFPVVATSIAPRRLDPGLCAWEQVQRHQLEGSATQPSGPPSKPTKGGGSRDQHRSGGHELRPASMRCDDAQGQPAEVLLEHEPDAEIRSREVRSCLASRGEKLLAHWAGIDRGAIDEV